MKTFNKFIGISLIGLSAFVAAYDSTDWDASTVSTTTSATADATAPGVTSANAINLLNICALASNCSSITLGNITDAGGSATQVTYLSAYQAAIAAESGVASSSALQTIINATNSSSAPSVANAISSATSATEDSSYSYSIPTNVFSGTGTLTYSASISGSSGLSYNAGVISGTPTVPGIYTVTYTATDGTSQSLSTTFVILVANTNDAPVLGGDITASIAENSTSGSVGTISASDDDGDTITYTISGTGSANFTIDASTGAVSVASSATLDYETATSYALTITATDTNSSSDTALASVTITDVVETQSVADAITGSGTVTTSALSSVGVSSTIITDLTTNNNCGTSGTQNCLIAFNAASGSTSCTALPGSGATNAQIGTFVNCVMLEINVSQATAISTTQTPTASSSASCSASVNMPIPSTCAHSQWSCAIQGATTPASGYTVNSSNAALAHTYNGTPSTATYTIRASLGIYSPAYTRDYTYTVSIPGSTPTVAVNQYSFSGSAGNAWNLCLAKPNGLLADTSQVRAMKGWGSTWPSAYNSGGISRIMLRDSNADRTYQHSCSSGYSATKMDKISLNYSGGATITNLNYRSSGSSPIKYENSDGNISNGSCRGAGSSGTYTYFCQESTYSCPG
jgi:hypothetical protein